MATTTSNSAKATGTSTSTVVQPNGPAPTFSFVTGGAGTGSGNLPSVTGGSGIIFNFPTGTSPFAYPTTYPPGTGGPNDPNFNHDDPNSGSSKGNLGMIVGITVAGVAFLAMAGLFFQRYRARSRSNAINSHQSRSRTRHNQTTAPPHLPPPGGAGHLSSGDEELQRGDKAKLAKSFTIRKPPSVYVDDDQDLDQTGHPRYNSDGDARHHPYYGHAGPGGLVEYELSDTRGQQYEPTSVAERKRYVEQQHRKVMEEYEMYNPHKDMPPPSPYPPSHGTAAPSYTSGGVGGATSPPLNSSVLPSMGGRSPRVNPPGHPHSPSPFGRSQDDYPY